MVYIVERRRDVKEMDRQAVRQTGNTDRPPSRRTRKTGRLSHCDSLVAIH